MTQCYPLKFELCTFGSRAVPRRALGEIIYHLVEVLTVANLVYLAEHPATPELYDSGVRYEEDEGGAVEKKWWDIPRILQEGVVDCKGAAAWRKAELEHQGIPCEIIVHEEPSRDLLLFHVTIDCPYGPEDPSRILGMR